MRLRDLPRDLGQCRFDAVDSDYFGGGIADLLPGAGCRRSLMALRVHLMRRWTRDDDGSAWRRGRFGRGA